MKNIKVALLFLIGVFLISTGFFIGRSSKEESIKHKESASKTLPSNIPSYSILGNKESSITANVVAAEVLIARVLDGDTIETSSGERISYIGINSPEKGQPFSSEAAALNNSLVLRKTVRLKFDIQTKDRYGRTLAYIFAGDTFVNLEMVKKGLAVVETIQQNAAYQDEFVKAQKEARNNCLGLWRGLCSGKEKG